MGGLGRPRPAPALAPAAGVGAPGRAARAGDHGALEGRPRAAARRRGDRGGGARPAARPRWHPRPEGRARALRPRGGARAGRRQHDHPPDGALGGPRGAHRPALRPGARRERLPRGRGGGRPARRGRPPGRLVLALGVAHAVRAGLEHRDALDVRRLGEHVHRADLAQHVAGFHELRRVRRERRGIARDVDDPLGRRLDDPAHDLLREPRARGVDHEHVRAARLLDQVAKGQPHVPREEVGVQDVVAAGVGDRVGDRGLHELQPPDLARARGQHERDRPRAAVEVVDPLPALERGVLHGHGVQALGHLRVRLEERLGGDRELQAAELLHDRGRGAADELGPAARRRLPRALDDRPHHGGGLDGGRERVRVELARRRDHADLELPRPPRLAQDEVAQEARLRAAVVGLELLLARPREHLLAGAGGALRAQQGDPVDDLLPRPRRVEAADELTGRARPERVLELVAVAPLLLGRDDRLELEAVQVADAAQGVVDLLGLDLELARVGQDLPGGAGMVRAGRDPLGARGQELDDAGLAVALLALGDLHPRAVARDGAGDEQHVALVTRHAVAAVGQAVDGDVEDRAGVGAAGAGGGLHGGPG
ncbi:MAG: hypothetical protein AVDCRST_MAG13-1638 [uncultured Solirubrobacteraceae bacterium]|uniref:Uncharacterized protein n=1 Tax=uncultured Solirubrobacteraceae bacterium TaxID=1162706 RepID=A0A6J4SDU3_9ACTN|nr:MAG: hypothetical protein AVDCRST_MAG13-1638 [uncultured Solirubrobacteraceae bacterium]